MFDTMTLTKIVGGVCGALLIFLFGNWAANSIYGFGEVSHEEGATLSYSVAGAEAEGEAPAAEGEAEPDFAVVFAAADATAGERSSPSARPATRSTGQTAPARI